MLDLYTWATPNGHRVSIMLEELGLPYATHAIDLDAGAQFDPGFLTIAPNNKIPVLVDTDAHGDRRVLFESGAILIYLAEQSGQLMAPSGPARDKTLEWLFWATTAVGPMFGQFGHFAWIRQEQNIATIEHFTEEAIRLMGVLERRLADEPYLAGDYSIADIAAFSWIKSIAHPLRDRVGPRLGPIQNTDRWLTDVGSRPAVLRGQRVPKAVLRTGEEARLQTAKPA
jgi:GST-like protein